MATRARPAPSTGPTPATRSPRRPGRTTSSARAAAAPAASASRALPQATADRSRSWRSRCSSSARASLIALALPRCAHTTNYSGSPQWRGDHFENPSGDVAPRLANTLRYQLAPSTRDADRAWAPPRVANDGSLLRDVRLAPAATWIGHSTVLLSLRGANVLTDPMFAEHLFTLRRRAPPGVALADLPPLAAVLVSHDHADHLDAEAVRAIGDRPRWIVPLGLAPWLRAHGIENVIELDWWQSTELARPGLPPLRVTL